MTEPSTGPADIADSRVAVRLTLLILLLRPPENGVLHGLVWLVAGAALVLPGLSTRSSVWLTLTGLMCARLVRDWPLSDNHIYLLAYWCLAIALAYRTQSPAWTLSRTSRWLLGLTFLCALIWKAVLAPDFLDARFFRVTLVTDPRFESLARAVGGLTAAQIDDNRAALEPLQAGLEVIDGPVLVEPRALRLLALGLTWGGLVLEALLAAAFLIRAPGWVVRARHALLMLFCVFTYAVAPVGGFGWLLVAMGLAQTDPKQVGLRVAYLAVFALVVVYAEMPLVSAILEWAAS